MTHPTLSKAYSQAGSNMGRSDVNDDSSMSLPVVFTVALLKMVDGDYDEGGAYWGAGDRKIGYMYRATADGEDNQIDLFFRAASVDKAKDYVKYSYPLATFTGDTLDEFAEAYVTAALWATTGDDDKPLDDEYSVADLAPETATKVIAECARFQAENAAWLTDEHLIRSICSVAPQAGHDFFLTRNGHGAGFWDGDWSDAAGKALTAASKAFGEVNFYAGDDGQIYC